MSANGKTVRTMTEEEVRKILERTHTPCVNELQGETVRQRLYALLAFLNRRYDVNFGLMEEKDCGACASFKGSPADDPPTPPKTVCFNWRGKYADSVRHAVEVFCHEYGHLLLVEMGWRDYEQECTQFADLIVKEIEVACPEFLYGDVDFDKGE
jgi:hypothetical protein